MTLGKVQEKVLSALTTEPQTVQQISDSTGIELHKVKNILMEFSAATISNRSIDNTYRLNKTVHAPKNDSDEPSLWEPVKLKNLSRIL